MRVEFLNEIHDVQILRTFRLVRGLISVLRNVLAAGTFPFSFDLVGSCEEGGREGRRKGGRELIRLVVSP